MFGIKAKNRRAAAAQPVRRRAATDDSSSSSSALFRRNRTLTGSLISSVPSPNEQSASLQSPRVQTHNLKRKRRSIRLALLSALALIAALSWLLVQIIVVPKVQIVGTDDNNTLAQAATRDYTAAIQDYLSDNPLERLTININPRNLNRIIQSRFPEVASVSPPAKVSLWTATFAVNLRSPVVYWQSGNTKAYVDNAGIVFDRNVLGGSVIAVEDQTGISADAGNSVISSRFLQFIGKAVGYFKENNLIVTKIALPADTTRQLLISIDGVGYTIKMTVDRPAAGQVEDAIRAVSYLSGRGIAAKYIDVRVSRRAFYR
jgi:hypothetical protein cdivTM_00555